MIRYNASYGMTCTSQNTYGAASSQLAACLAVASVAVAATTVVSKHEPIAVYVGNEAEPRLCIDQLVFDVLYGNGACKRAAMQPASIARLLKSAPLLCRIKDSVQPALHWL
jgi:hypothetical protein